MWVTLEEMCKHLGGVRRSGRGELDVVGCVLPGWAVEGGAPRGAQWMPGDGASRPASGQAGA